MQASGPSPEAQADALLLHFLSPLSDSDTPSWSDALSQAVKERRGLAVGGQLLVDRLLQEAGVSSSLFPPSSPSDAFVLMVEVLTSAAPDLLKSELMYYLGLHQIAQKWNRIGLLIMAFSIEPWPADARPNSHPSWQNPCLPHQHSC